MRVAWHPVHSPDDPCPCCGEPVATNDEQVGLVLIFGTRCTSCGWGEIVLAEPAPML